MALEIVLLTGMSGSGKSVALHALEDTGYYCVDNLPPELLSSFVALEHKHHGNRVAIAMDVRSATGLPQLPQQLAQLRSQGVTVQSLFLDATTDTLVRRFSETRRRHPLTKDDLLAGRRALVQTIELERELLAGLREQAHVIDTSAIRASQLQSYIKSLVATPSGQLTLVFQSFAFKRGIPMDADYVFDVRMLPNPHYEPSLRDLTGQDPPVAEFLRQQPDVLRMQQHIAQFLDQWLDLLAQNHRSYVTVAVGCTGGQHRSVYLVERLCETFGQRWTTLRRHRELDGR
ncbi:RNase adapter RapZ [Paenacidovorax monticola]|uniref:RNase adapter RapZ n=1 Tax=Paenacidovorax monticola TaxID=1926868 RepID=A0A7H0HF54_9BURK|nr:RNase adapter RapZ [Paenacidovorax monticola]MBO9679222.1 RNase adapter RapZ [Acidovorax sp.]QNP59170.1 RNase adapter RapZ [Paenacidovorax monticola]